jgi:HEAT repeat protein
MEALTCAAGQALACLPPDSIPDFWQTLAHAPLTHRLAIRPVLTHIDDRHAVPFLLNVVPGQPAPLTQAIAACLGRLKDVRALPALMPLTLSRDRQVRTQAIAAIAAIEHAHIGHPARELLRAPNTAPEEVASLLRPTPLPPNSDPPEELLRVSAGACPAQER